MTDEPLFCPDCHDRCSLVHEEGGTEIYGCSNQHHHPKQDLLTREEAVEGGDQKSWRERLGI